LAPTIVFVALVAAVVGSLGAPLVTAVAGQFDVSLAAAQWTLTIALLAGAVATPVLGRLGSGPARRRVVLGTLAVVVAGSVLTVLPVPFALLLVGRAAHGVGLGLTPLMMATARDHLPAPRAAATIALLAVASTVGIGVGYPVAGLLTDLAGVRAAYALGLVVTLAALVAAAVVLPDAPERPAIRVDLGGAALLTAGLLGLLLAVSQTDLWRTAPAVCAAVLVAAAALLALWARREARSPAPLVDVRLLRHRPVALANLAMLVGGVGMYLLLSVITRYVQTPVAAGYGFGLTTAEAGLVLVPFSVLGFVAGKVVPPLRRRVDAHVLLLAGAVAVLVAFLLFTLARAQAFEVVVAMAVLGFGVGTFSAALPAVILAVTPEAETASAMGVNQVVRSVGFSLGSALGGFVLAGYTAAGGLFPDPDGYTAAGWAGVVVTGLTVLAVLPLHRAAAGRR
jgi:predicted MFS family arabinose efflux permease